jgi:uncharacterized protein (DUF2267 family)
MDKRAFVREVAGRLHADKDRAEAVTAVVFTELRDRLTPKEAADVAAQLSDDLRRMWDALDRPVAGIRKVRAHEFIGRVRRLAVLPDDTEAERAVRAVFGALQGLLGSPTGTEGEAWDVFSVLPGDLKRLWLESSERGGS